MIHKLARNNAIKMAMYPYIVVNVLLSVKSVNELMGPTQANCSGVLKLNRLATVGSEQKPEEVSIVVSLNAKYPQHLNCGFAYFVMCDCDLMIEGYVRNPTKIRKVRGNGER